MIWSRRTVWKIPRLFFPASPRAMSQTSRRTKPMAVRGSNPDPAIIHRRLLRDEVFSAGGSAKDLHLTQCACAGFGLPSIDPCLLTASLVAYCVLLGEWQ